MNEPIVTVICTCYNHEKYVRNALSSVINQSYKHIELIIVDNASTDNSKSEIALFLIDYPEIVFISNEENIGLPKSFNAAVKLSKGKYLIDLAADDTLDYERVKLQVAAFEKLDASYGLLYSNIEEVDKNGKHLRYSLTPTLSYPSGDLLLEILNKHFIPSPSTIFKKSAFDEVGGYNENLFFEDFDFWVRCAAKYCFYYLPINSGRKTIVENSFSSFFYSKAKSKNMLDSTLQTYKWASKKVLEKGGDMNLGLIYYFRQATLMGHFELALEFRRLLNSSDINPISSLLFNLVLKYKIDLSRLYLKYRKMLKY
jgi:glycosyltransferase involved in cell wall biosynthesis